MHRSPSVAAAGVQERGQYSRMCPRRRGKLSATPCRGRFRHAAEPYSPRPFALSKFGRSCPRCQAAARSRAACAPGRGRLAPVPADPAACATGLPLPYPPRDATVVYYNASQLRRFRKKKKYESEENVRTAGTLCEGRIPNLAEETGGAQRATKMSQRCFRLVRRQDEP